MATINFLNEAAPNKSLEQNSAQLINMYLAPQGDSGKYQSPALPTPGLTTLTTLISPVRALFAEHGVLYAVGGNKFYSITSGGTATILGTLNTSTGFAKIAGINQELLIVDGTNGYCWNITTATFTTIASTGNSIQQVTIQTSGTLYSPADTVVFTGGGGTGAAGTITVVGGQITVITMTAAGSGYTSAPAVSITTSTGSGFAGTAILQTNAFVNMAVDCWAQDEFGLTISPNSQQWNASAISDLTTWPALSFAATTGNQNNLVAIAGLHREIFLFQTDTTEVWDNLGTANFTFGRNQSVFIEWGCAATQSVAKGNNTLVWLGRSITGGVQVVKADGYSPQVISTEALNYQFSTYSTVSDAMGFCYQQEGHEFYVLTFPTANITWVYDFTTQLWHQRTSLVSATQQRWLGQCAASVYNATFVGDWNSGKVYRLDMTVATEGGSTAITRTITSHPFYSEGMWITCDRLQIDFDEANASASNAISLFISRDGGRTFGSAKPNTLAGAGNTISGPRVWWARLGSAKIFVFRITTTMSVPYIVLGAWATVRGGAS